MKGSVPAKWARLTGLFLLLPVPAHFHWMPDILPVTRLDAGCFFILIKTHGVFCFFL
jgi:hypothetical protein